MPDLIRLVHGNIAGIRTLQHEFREYWRREELSRRSGKSTHTNTDKPSTTTSSAETTVRCTSEVSEGLAAVSPLPSVTADVDISTNEQTAGASSICPNSPVESLIPVGDGTPVSTSTGVTLPVDNTADQIDCSISKRQLLITITAIAVRERRPAFPRTCWYVHQHLLDKYNLQNLPIPSQWQNLTKPQKVLHAESPLPGHSMSTFGNDHLVGYAGPTGRAHQTVESLPMIMQQNQMMQVGAGHQSVNPGLYLSPNYSIPHPSGVSIDPHRRLQGNTVRESLAFVRSGQVNPLTGVNIHQPMHQSSGGVYLPLQVPNGMSASEIMQKLSASVPMQHFQPTQSQTHAFSPTLSSEQIHYLNMLPKRTIVSHPTMTAPTVGLPSATSQMNKIPTSSHVKVPRTNPTDIKNMLVSQVAKVQAANPSNVINLSNKASVIPTSQASSSSAIPASSNPDESGAVPSPQQPTKKTATLKNFFNLSVRPLPKSPTHNKTETSASSKDNNTVSKETSLGEGDVEQVSIKEGSVQAITADIEMNKGKSSIGKDETKAVESHEEKMEVEVSKVVNSNDVDVIVIE